ncbi:Histone [Ecytonucleospora hepatopenaei]|uniref:Histone n=1 Tax=Ecytonucleospora hepatopenaei TaxID=646526 RepID=A0A1W0E6L1_9MICR|nr:Histone [Ecytonucleospora hepatopenaei]
MRTKNQNTTVFKGGKVLKENNKNTKTLGSLKPNSQLTPQKKFQPGKLALKEIRKYQQTTDLVVRKAPFKRLVKNILQGFEKGDTFRFQQSSFTQLQTAYEYFMVSVLEDALRLTIHAKRKTLFGDDIKLIYRIKHARDFDVNMTN